MVRHAPTERGSHRLLRRAIALMGAGLLAVSPLSCRKAIRSERDASSVTIAVPDVSVLLPDVGDADFLVFLPLATLDKDGRPEGRLAERWEVSEDYREMTYYLRTDVRWHDGKPVTAHDVKFTLDLLSHPDVHEYVFDSVTVLDDSTIRIRSHEHSYMCDIAYFPMHSLEHLDPKDFWDWPFWREPKVGNGPYRFVRHVPQTMIEFKANPDYYRGKPTIERVVLKFVGQGGLTGARLTELLSGNVDVVPWASSADIPKLANDPRFQVYFREPFHAGASGIYWQHRHHLFRDPRVQRALTLAINRRDMLQVLNYPNDIPLFDGPITIRQLRQRQFPDPLPYDPEQSRTLLASAGWHDSDGDGVCEKQGQRFKFTACVPIEILQEKMPEYVQSELRHVGVQMDFKPMDFTTVWEKLDAGDFDAAFMVVQSRPSWYLSKFGKDSAVGYDNAQVIDLLEQALATADPGEQDQIHRELLRIFRIEQPLTYLGPHTGTFLVHRRIKGLSSPYRADPIVFMEDLWLEDQN